MLQQRPLCGPIAPRLKDCCPTTAGMAENGPEKKEKKGANTPFPLLFSYSKMSHLRSKKNRG